MKTQFFTTARIARNASVLLSLPFQMLPVAEGDTTPQDIEVADIARLCVRVNSTGETGLGSVIGTEGATRYEIAGSTLRVYLSPIARLGDMFVIVDGSYGEIRLHEVVNITVANDGATEVVCAPYVFAAIAAGGGGDGMEQYRLTLVTGRQAHFVAPDGSIMTFDDVKNAVLDSSKFVFLDYASCYHIPCFVVDAEGNEAVGFTSAFSVDGKPHIERVAISQDGSINTHNYPLVAFGSNNGVEIGNMSHANGANSHAEGFGTNAEGNASHAEGRTTNARGAQSHSEGINSFATGNYSHAEGEGTTASGYASHAEGEESVADGKFSHAEGDYTVASGDYSHAEGDYTVASGDYSHTEGDRSKAKHDYTHAEGSDTTASEFASHAEGGYTTSEGDYAHAEGFYTDASGMYSHAEGYHTETHEDYSHAEGGYTDATGTGSHAEGNHTSTTFDYQHAQGQYNNPDDCEEMPAAFMHGCGTGETDRKNAMVITDTGQIYIIDLGGYNGKNLASAQSLQQLLGVSNIQASSNVMVNNYQVPQLTTTQVTQAYNAVVAGRPVTITDATGNYHLSVMQADNLNGDLAISIIYLNVMLLTYEIVGGSVDVQFKNL